MNVDFGCISLQQHTSDHSKKTESKIKDFDQ